MPLLLSLFALLAPLWSGDGHQLVCEVAWRHLSPAARTMVLQLRADETGTFAESCTWADEVRPDRPETYNYHFVSIPGGAAGVDLRRDCGDPAKRCAIWAIKHYAIVLTDRAATPTQRQEALKFLGHFVGDLHQPLHAGRPHDRGGNDVKVSFFGNAGSAERAMNLHSVWDSQILRRANIGWPESADELVSGITTQQVSQWATADVIGWANESYRIDEDFVYGVPPGGNIDHAYYNRALAIARVRLQQGGIRLAHLLNEAARGRTSFTY